MFEGNTFNKSLVDFKQFKNYSLVNDKDILDKYRNTGTELGGFIEVLEKNNISITPTISNSVFVAGRLEEEVYLSQKRELIKRINKNKNIDGILLALHGNMLSEKNDDCEGEILEEIRQIVGDEVYVVCTLDKHAIVTDKMVKFADDLISYDTAPHIDMFETGERAASILLKLIENKIKTYISFQKLPALFHGDKMISTKEPLSSFLREAKVVSEQNEVISVSVFFGCPTLDIKEAGPSIIVTTEINKKEQADRESLALAKKFWDLRENFLIKHIPIEEAINKALKIDGGPVIFLDPADNINAGAYGDTTCILQGLIREKVDDAALAVIIDSESVKKAIRLGVGKKAEFELGGKLDKINSKPLKIISYIKMISDGKYIYKGHLFKGTLANMGRTLVLEVNGIYVIITENQPANVADPELFRSLGIEPMDKKIIVLKDGLHFRANYEKFAREIFYIDCPGSSDVNFDHIKYCKVPRPIFPLDKKVKFL
ncbi:MAG: M81 family metallopeptidase [Actinobacteria bacterium]|nr:M81 family metallopeptidase [Actinomycetota bacterium]